MIKLILLWLIQIVFLLRQSRKISVFLHTPSHICVTFAMISESLIPGVWSHWIEEIVDDKKMMGLGRCMKVSKINSLRQSMEDLVNKQKNESISKEL